MPTLQFKINGRAVQVPAEAHDLLVDVIRGPLALTGTHVGCARLMRRLHRAGRWPGDAQLHDARCTTAGAGPTVEGLARDGKPHTCNSLHGVPWCSAASVPGM
jgi:hypothetical protein